MQKIKQKLSNTLGLNFCYLKIICFLHSQYHPKIIGDQAHIHISKRLVKLTKFQCFPLQLSVFKLTKFQCFPLQLSGYENLPLLSFVLHYQL